MRDDVNPVVAIGAIAGILAVIGLVLFVRGKPGQQAGIQQKNQQIVGQMQQAGSTAANPTATAPPQAMQMQQAGQGGGGMMGGSGAPSSYAQPGR